MNYRYYERFETLYASSGSIIVFILFFTLLCGWFLKTCYENYARGKSIYTMLALPVKREALYFSKVVSFAIALLALIAAQLLSVLLFYGWFIAGAANADQPELLMHNGLFLAFLRSEFLRILLPLHWQGMLSTFSMFVAVVVGVYYGALCERSKRYWGFIVIWGAAMIMIRMLLYRLEEVRYSPFYDTLNLPLYSGLLLFLCGWMVWHSLHLLKKGAIV